MLAGGGTQRKVSHSATGRCKSEIMIWRDGSAAEKDGAAASVPRALATACLEPGERGF